MSEYPSGPIQSKLFKSSTLNIVAGFILGISLCTLAVWSSSVLIGAVRSAEVSTIQKNFSQNGGREGGGSESRSEGENEIQDGSDEDIDEAESITQKEKAGGYDFETFRYDPTGLRDPFLSPFPQVTQVQGGTLSGEASPNPIDRNPASLTSFNVEDFEVKAILLGIANPTALLQTPNGFRFSVRERTRIGRHQGYIQSIGEGEIIIKEKDSSGRVLSKSLRFKEKNLGGL